MRINSGKNLRKKKKKTLKNLLLLICFHFVFKKKTNKILFLKKKNERIVELRNLRSKTVRIDRVLYPNYVHRLNAFCCSLEIVGAIYSIGWHLWWLVF